MLRASSARHRGHRSAPDPICRARQTCESSTRQVGPGCSIPPTRTPRSSTRSHMSRAGRSIVREGYSTDSSNKLSPIPSVAASLSWGTSSASVALRSAGWRTGMERSGSSWEVGSRTPATSRRWRWTRQTAMSICRATSEPQAASRSTVSGDGTRQPDNGPRCHARHSMKRRSLSIRRLAPLLRRVLAWTTLSFSPTECGLDLGLRMATISPV